MNLIRVFAGFSAAALLSACMTTTPSRDYSPPPSESRAAVEYSAPAAPMSMHDQVHNALRDGMGASASDIEVRVDGSTVYLGGHVGSQADHKRAHDIAHRVPGVTTVNHSGLMVH